MGNKKEKKFYTAYEISKKYGIFIDTVYKRMQSKFARERWGVVSRMKKELVVPVEELEKWENPVDYRGKKNQ